VIPLMLERPLFLRERADGLFRPITFLIFRAVHEFLMNVLCATLASLLLFYPMRLQGSFFVFWLAYLLMQIIGTVLAYAIVALSDTMDVASAYLGGYVVRTFCCSVDDSCAHLMSLAMRRAWARVASMHEPSAQSSCVSWKQPAIRVCTSLFAAATSAYAWIPPALTSGGQSYICVYLTSTFLCQDLSPLFLHFMVC
jgi:hypothetical protein